MRVLLLTPDAYGGHGGIAKYNRDFIAALCAHDAVEDVVTIPRGVPGEMEALPPKLVFRTEAAGSKGRFLWTVGKQLHGRRPVDLVICGHMNLLPPAIVASRRYGAPLLLLIYGIDVWSAPAPWSRLMSRSLSGVISISRITADRFQQWAPVASKPLWLLPNAIELGVYAPGPKSPELLDRYGLRGRVVIGTLARLAALERMKGIDETLASVARLAARIPNLSYLVMGDGSDRGRLESLARRHRIESRVIFTGRLREEEKAEHYRLLDAYVMPSQGEGFGFVFLEALASGIPVVASKLDGGREAVRDGILGELVDPSDPADVDRGILAALSVPTRAVHEGLTYFSFENFTKRVHAILDAFARN